jgi:ABC-type sugar transport system ATPase subunit
MESGSSKQDGALLLRVTSVVKSYGAVQALRGVSLDVHRGEVVALAGENGSGKSTLSKVISGVVKADAGTVDLVDAGGDFSSPRGALDAGVALVSQEPNTLPSMTVAENVLLARLHRPGRLISRARLSDAALPYLERVGVRVDPTTRMGALAAGDRELVELAKALAVEPRLLILDEVTARLPDPERLFTVVETLVAEGVAVVFITHRLREIRRLAHRTVVLRDGEVAGHLTGAEMTDERISSTMVGRDLGTFFHKVPADIGAVALQVDGVVTDRSTTPISLQVRHGEIVGVAGLVGSGRSELLESIAGARRRRAGSVRIDGDAVSSQTPRGAMAAGIGFVPEDRYHQGLVRPHAIAANIGMPWLSLLSRTRRRADRSRAQRAVDRYRIRCANVDAPVASLSGGNAQKVVLAKTLTKLPSVLLLDEPTRGVDVGAREEIYRTIGELVTNGVAVLMASSDLLEILGLCDRIIVLHDGEVAGELTRAEATEEAVALLSHGGGRQ